MTNAARSLPLLLASRLSARRSERLGRQFDAILKRMPQAVVFVGMSITLKWCMHVCMYVCMSATVFVQINYYEDF